MLVRLMAGRRKKNPKREMPPALKRYWQARNKRLRNPKRRAALQRRRNPVQTQHVLLAQRGRGPVLKYVGGIKFARTGKAIRFADKAAASQMGATLKRLYAVLRPYRVWAT
jgi:hypothetical protein